MKQWLALIVVVLLGVLSVQAVAEYDEVVPCDDARFQWCRKDDYWYFCNADGVAFQGYRWTEEDFGTSYCKFFSTVLSDHRIALCMGPRQTDQWGIIDTDGNIVVEPQYGFIGPFGNGNFVVKQKWNYGVIDPDGNIVIDLKYLDIRYREGDTLYPFWLRGKWGFMDADGNHIIQEQYDEVSYMSNWAWVRIDSKYDVHLKYGIIDPEGNIIFEPIFDAAPQLYEDYARVQIGDKYGIAAPNGSYILDPIYDEIGDWNHPYGPTPVCLNGQWGFMNASGEWALPPIYEDAYRFNKSEIAYVKTNGLWGIIDITGTYVIEPSFELIYGLYQNEYHMVQVNGKWGIIDLSGKYLINPIYDEMHSSGNCDVSKYGTWDYTEEEYHVVQGDREYYFDIVDGKVIPGGEGDTRGMY